MSDDSQVLGLKVLYEPSSAGINSDFDIVAVHALKGHYLLSWTEPDSKICWLRDLLPVDFPNARIMTFDYSIQPVDPFDRELVVSLEDIGEMLRADLETLRSTANTQSRPIIFIAHSLGGLAVKQALSRRSQLAPPNRIAVKTVGIFFFGTPHNGTVLNSYDKVLQTALSILYSVNGKSVILKERSEELDRLNETFHRDLHDTCLCNFFETVPTSGHGIVVTKESMFLGLPNETLIAVRSPHRLMVKFKSDTSKTYLLTVNAVRKSLGLNSPLIRSTGPRDTISSIKRESQAHFVFDALADFGGVETGSALAEAWFRDLNDQVLPFIEERYKDKDMPVKIAILDSGVDVGHPELKKYFERNQIRYKSFIDGEEGNVDVCAHGTHMTHLILRVAPRAQVFVGRVFISGQATEMETNKMGIEKAIRYATHEEKVDIISMSWGYRIAIPEILSALRDAFHHSKILLAAASNSGAYAKNNVAFPACMRQVICVNSTDGYGNPSEMNPSPHPDRTFMVIGEGLSVACPLKLGSPLRVIRGTSAATAIATGIAALVLQYASYHGNRGQRVEQRERLDCDGMRKIFAGMADERNGYNALVPAKLFYETGEDRHFRICQNLARLLDEL